jgi:hypothetical protein
MNKKFIPILMLISMLSSSLFSQRNCASHGHMQQMLHENATFKQNHEVIENQTADYTTHPTKQLRALKTIPVVVHVVYNTTAQNISDAQIASQIDVLNKDFRKLNADFSNTPAAFQGIAADCELEFCLAKQTPTGALTTGIVRKQTALTSFSDDDKVKSSTLGGDNAWDATKYLNLWVCPLGGGLLGYAQFPGGPVSTDGVVINVTAFGTTGTATAPFNKGRTATHEVGHWLNLYHIWGDDGTACTGSDLVGDTPNQADENYGCPTFPAVSCSNSPNGDMFMNYMDYTDDACMYMFTSGQKTRIDALFTSGGSRASLLTSLGCVVPNTTTCNIPVLLSASSITANTATLNWGVVTNATSYNVQYKLNGSATWTTVTSTTNSKAIVGLSAASAYQFQVETICANGSSTYSAVSSFMTTSNVPSCTNTYEPNNTLATAISIVSNTSITSLISTSTDKDYYQITTTAAAPKLKVTLTNLPADYDLRLYNANGSQIGSSSMGNNTSESISYNTSTTAQTYRIYVFGYNGAFNASSCYTLATQTSATNLKVDATVGEQKIAMAILPNPAYDKIEVQFTSRENETSVINVYNTLGQKVASRLNHDVYGINHTTLDLSHCSAGIYLVEMISNDERHIQQIAVTK